MRRRSFDFSFTMTILTLVFLSWSAEARPQVKVVDLSAVGGPPSKAVLAYRVAGRCESEVGQEDCRFVSPDGVEYDVYDGQICEIHVDVTKVSGSLSLPYGLKFGDTQVEALRKLPKVKGVDGSWFVSGIEPKHFAGRRGYFTGGGFYGGPDSLAGLYLWFDAGGFLVEVEAHETCV